MTGKRAENSMEIRARALLGLKPVDIHHEVYDIFGDDQMSYRWVAKVKAGQLDLKDAAHSGRPQTSTKSNIKKITDLLNQTARYTVKGFRDFILGPISTIERQFSTEGFSIHGTRYVCLVNPPPPRQLIRNGDLGQNA